MIATTKMKKTENININAHEQRNMAENTSIYRAVRSCSLIDSGSGGRLTFFEQ